MIKVLYNGKEYLIDKDKLLFVLEKLNGSKVSDDEVFELMEKFCLLDEGFLDEVNGLW